jgi:hypothetical protein
MSPNPPPNPPPRLSLSFLEDGAYDATPLPSFGEYSTSTFAADHSLAELALAPVSPPLPQHIRADSNSKELEDHERDPYRASDKDDNIKALVVLFGSFLGTFASFGYTTSYVHISACVLAIWPSCLTCGTPFQRFGTYLAGTYKTGTRQFIYQLKPSSICRVPKAISRHAELNPVSPFLKMDARCVS